VGIAWEKRLLVTVEGIIGNDSTMMGITRPIHYALKGVAKINHLVIACGGLLSIPQMPLEFMA